MKRIKSLCFFGIAMMVMMCSIGSIGSVAQEVKRSPEPSYECVKIPLQIQEIVNKELCVTNQLLLTTIGLLPGLSPEQLDHLKPIIKMAFRDSYLKDPKFTPEGGNPIEGWDDILPVLQGMAIKMKGRPIPIKAIFVTGKFLAYDLERTPSLDKDEDLILHIRMIMDLGSDDGWEGDLRHRRLCDLY